MALDPPQPIPPEVVISAERAADTALESKVIEVLRDDPYVFSEHVSVTVVNGIVTVEGTVPSVQDMRRVLMLARRLAGKRRVINSLELDIEDDDGSG
jgi:osmotically-inducible protein OsmY